MKHSKTVKLLALLCLGAVLLLSLASCSSSTANAADANGTWGSLTWSYKKDNKTLTIMGSGEMDDFENSDAVEWSAVRTSATTVVIEDGITSIGDYAFYYMPALTTIQLPSTVSELGDFSFAFCSALSTLTIPEGVTALGVGAFESCGALSSMYLPTSVETIGDSAFAFCYSLRSIMITSETVTIGAQAFRNCRSLEQVTLRSTISDNKIANDAFDEAFDGFSRTDKLLGSSTITVRYMLNDEEVGVYEEMFGYGVDYSIETPERDGYKADVEVVSGMGDGKDRQETVVYSEIPEEEAPKAAISPVAIVATIIMIAVLVGIGVVVFLLIRSGKSSKKSLKKKK